MEGDKPGRMCFGVLSRGEHSAGLGEFFSRHRLVWEAIAHLFPGCRELLHTLCVNIKHLVTTLANTPPTSGLGSPKKDRGRRDLARDIISDALSNASTTPSFRRIQVSSLLDFSPAEPAIVCKNVDSGDMEPMALVRLVIVGSF
jgi:hypothetical protein